TVHGLLGSRLSQQAGPLRLAYRSAWPIGTVIGAVLVLMAGMLVLVRGASWQMGLSSRYAAPAEAAKSDDPWRSLDRGEDPTISDG
ncbi:MAG TPA: Trp biosynthesis-associated membrane protein, partial [Jatrophihabitans sp.]|nr:Trp biosynthesis-associated membrane protein [Jatrophihabitans sp.]